MITSWGITVDQHAAILEAQGGGCAICRCLMGDSNGVMKLPHGHEVLCMNCSRYLAHFRSDPERLRRAIRYLEGEHDGEPRRLPPGRD